MLHVLDGGVGLDVTVHFVGKAGFLHQVGHLFGHAELDQVGVGGHEGLFAAARGELGQDVFDGAVAVIGNGIEHDTISHGYLLLPVITICRGKPR